MNRQRYCLFVAFATAMCVPAGAQWTVTDLHNSNSTYSGALSVNGGQQAGYAFVGNQLHSSLWSSSAASWVDLNPSGSVWSDALGVSGGQQVGLVQFVRYHPDASLWSGTAGSWTDLSPTGSSDSIGYGVDAGQQVGFATFGGRLHAGMWNGTAASWFDLSPAGSANSIALAVKGGQQVGYASFGGPVHAGLWNGSVASWVDLDPAGSTISQAWGVGGGHQVGYARVGNVSRASLWSGTASSWVDLNPNGSTESWAFGVEGGLQVGYAVVGGQKRASLWSGSAGSWIDLGSFLPSEFSYSGAHGIWSDASFIYVVGSGFDTSVGHEHALLWKHTRGSLIAPAAYEVFRGVLESGGLNEIAAPDQQYMVIRNGITALRSESPITLRVSAASPVQTPTSFQFNVENKVSITGLTQRVDLFDYNAGTFVNANTSSAATIDTLVSVTGGPANVESGTMNIKSQLRIRADGPVFTNTWRSYVDQTAWIIS